MPVRVLLWPVLLCLGAFAPPSAPPLVPHSDVRPLRLAALDDSIPRAFLGLVNKRIMGRIEARGMRYDAPSTISLADVALFDPAGQPVVRVDAVKVSVEITPLLRGELVVKEVMATGPTVTLAMVDTTDGKRNLNLLEAFVPRTPPKDDDDAASGVFEINSIRVTGGRFRFFDDVHTVAVTARNVDAVARLDVDLRRKNVSLDVSSIHIADGSVELKPLDVSLSDVRAARVRVINSRLEVQQVTGTVLGGKATVDGSIAMAWPGNFRLTGQVQAPANTWPERLKRLDFATPKASGTVTLTGSYEAPVVAIDADLGATTLYGYSPDGAHANVVVTRDDVRINAGSVLRVGSGSAKVTGRIAFEDLVGTIDVDARGVPLATVLRPITKETPVSGTLAGTASIAGVFDGQAPLLIHANLKAQDPNLYSVHPRGEVQVTGQVKVQGRRIDVQEAKARHATSDTVVHVSGTIDLEAERLELALRGTGDDVARVLADPMPEVVSSGVRFVGQAKGPFADVRVTGDVVVATATLWGVPCSDVTLGLWASSTRAQLSRLKGACADGQVVAENTVDVAVSATGPLTGRFLVSGVDLSRVRYQGEPLPITGVLSTSVAVQGSRQKPQVTLKAAIKGMHAPRDGHAPVLIGDTSADIEVTKSTLDLRNVSIVSEALILQSPHVEWNLDSDVIRGRADIQKLDTAKLLPKDNVRGVFVGALTLAGRMPRPDVTLRTDATDLAVGGVVLGSGPVVVALLPDPLSKAGSTATVALDVSSPRGRVSGELAYALSRKLLNSKLRVEDLDISALSSTQAGVAPHINAVVSGQATLFGPLSHLSGDVVLSAPAVAVRRLTSPDSGAQPEADTVGAVVVRAHLQRAALTASVCGMRSDDGIVDAAVTACDPADRLAAMVEGQVNLDDNAFHLTVTGHVREPAIERYVPSLYAQGFAAGADAVLTAKLDKKPNSDVVVVADATVKQASVTPPDAPTMALLKPTRLHYERDTVTLLSSARFLAPGGDADLTVLGNVGRRSLDLSVDGTASLALLKLLTSEIAAAKSTAALDLDVRGKYDEGVEVAGTVVPTPGAFVVLRSLSQRIGFASGGFRFTPVKEGQERRYRIQAENIRGTLGDGKMQLHGNIDVRVNKESDATWLTRFDVSLNADGITLKQGSNRASGNVDLRLTGDERASHLRGRIDVQDGDFRRDFELRNFVLSQAPTTRDEPLWQRLTPYGLGNLDLDVAVAMQNFRVLARITTFKADLSLRGNLQLRRTLRLPQLEGAVELEEGEIAFPRSRFEVSELQLEFPTTTDGRLVPLVHLAAQTEIPPGGAGTNDTEIPVDLTIDGGFESGMKVDLVALDPDYDWSRSELLALVLLGRTLTRDTLSAGDSATAVSALLHEATAPLASELEAAIADNLGANIDLDLSGWRWQVGRRLQLEGSGLLVNSLGGNNNSDTSADGTSTTGTGTTVTGAGTTSTAASGSGTTSSDLVRMRFLFVDHLPVGKNLSLEGRAGTTGSDVRLSLRLFEE